MGRSSFVGLNCSVLCDLKYQQVKQMYLVIYCVPFWCIMTMPKGKYMLSLLQRELMFANIWNRYDSIQTNCHSIFSSIHITTITSQLINYQLLPEMKSSIPSLGLIESFLSSPRLSSRLFYSK